MLVEHALIMGPGAGHHRHRWAAAEVVTGQRGQPRRFHDRLFAHRASKSDRSRTTVGRPGTRLVLWGRSCRVETHVHRDEFVTMDMGFDAAAPAPEHQPGARASDCGAGPIGFAGTVRKEAVVKAAGLTTLAGDDFGGGPTMPMMPGTWTHDQGVFDEHR